MAIVQPEAAGVAPPGPVSRYGVASPAAVSGCAGTTISQFVFAAGGVAAVADGHGVVPAGAVGAGAALELFAEAAGAGVPLEFVADGADAEVEVMPGAVEVGTTDAVAVGAAAALPPSLVGTGVAGADRTLLSATAMGTPAAASDLAGPANPAAAGAAQLPARPSVLLATVSMALMCGALRVAIPAMSATVRSPIIGTRRARGRSGKSRYLRASRRRYERTLR